MNIEQSKITKLLIRDLKALDPVTVTIEDLHEWAGIITITCYGKAWTAYWGSMGCNLAEFFCSCDNQYIAKNLSDLDNEVYDADKMNTDAEAAGISIWGRDDPWNDYDLMSQLYGNDMSEWSYQIPKKSNSEYTYLIRIIEAVKDALKVYLDGGINNGSNN